jgi:uncharacterized protein associated with vWA-MoxR-VMAP ternary system
MNEVFRKDVLKIGKGSLNDGEFRNRSLVLTPVVLNDLGNDVRLSAACAVVFDLTSAKRVLNRIYLGPVFEKCAAAGLITIVYSTDPQRTQEVLKMRDDFRETLPEHAKPALNQWLVIENEPAKIAEACARRNPGPPIGFLSIEFLPEASERLLDPGLKAQAEFLLRRAFYDFESITVRRLYGGKSADATFQVYANPKRPAAGPQPMPFFVKIGTWEAKLDQERVNYLDRAQPFIPFHLRPSLNRDRMIKGLRLSALVSDFVDNAIPLRTALKLGHGDGVLFSLFEHTLRGLRSHTESATSTVQTLRVFVDKRVRSQEIPSERIDEAKNLGLTKLPTEIEQELISIAGGRSARWGFYHGDLHAGNVMVRNRDAILIDFGSMEGFGPLAADPAILEVSLLFGTDDEEENSDFTKWTEFVDRLLVSPCEPPLPAAITAGNYSTLWLEDAVRELRHVVACCGSDEVELLTVIAAALLRYGRISALDSGTAGVKALDNRRHAYAIVCAERVARLAKKRAQESRSN